MKLRKILISFSQNFTDLKLTISTSRPSSVTNSISIAGTQTPPHIILAIPVWLFRPTSIGGSGSASEVVGIGSSGGAVIEIVHPSDTVRTGLSGWKEHP